MLRKREKEKELRDVNDSGEDEGYGEICKLMIAIFQYRKGQRNDLLQ